MPHQNPATRELTCTVLLCGPAGSGKSTTLRYLGGRARPAGSSSPFRAGSDALGLDLGVVSRFAVRFRLYAFSGQTSRETRQLLCDRADGVVFVADSQAVRLDENRACWDTVRESLKPDAPIVVQCNKQDLPRELLLPVDSMAAAFASSSPAIATDALHGAGVYETFTTLSNLVLARFA
jgi:signal recognition particle receptor subunit beta